jgi:methyl-accepting chemotaxis protein
MSGNSKQIAAAMNNVTKLTEESVSNTQRVSSASQEQMAAIEEISSSAQNLAQMAEDLQKQIAQFKI